MIQMEIILKQLQLVHHIHHHLTVMLEFYSIMHQLLLKEVVRLYLVMLGQRQQYQLVQLELETMLQIGVADELRQSCTRRRLEPS